jgi:Zn-dependent membrane protease YugP
MHLFLLALFVIALAWGPQWWARTTFQRYSKTLERIPGSGGELARHLLDRFELEDVGVEQTEAGDHYDPTTRTVRLGPDNFNNRSLTAIAVAAHEVGHAIQHARNEPRFTLRTRLVQISQSAQQLGALAMLAVPLIIAVTHRPQAGILLVLAGLLSMGSATVVHLVTLPVELDASFGKALPILRDGNYIDSRDEAAVRRILKAAAYTYVAASLASLLNIGRWVALLRRR